MLSNKQTKRYDEPKVLSEKLILSRCKTDDIKKIKKLNLWGFKLTDINILKEMPQLQIISLSTNYISNLEALSGCLDLQELYLRRNRITDLKEILHLKQLSHLHTLWLGDNPMCNETVTEGAGDSSNVSNINLYRAFVIKHLPQVQLLDDIEITVTERENIENLNRPPLITVENENSDVIQDEINDCISITNVPDDNFQPICSKEYNSSKYMVLSSSQNSNDTISDNSCAELFIKSTSNSVSPVCQTLLDFKAPDEKLKPESDQIGENMENSANNYNLHPNSNVITTAISQLIPLLNYEDLLLIKTQIESRLILIERE